MIDERLAALIAHKTQEPIFLELEHRQRDRIRWEFMLMDEDEVDELVLDEARKVMRKRRPDKTHWMLMDTSERQQEWDSRPHTDEPWTLGEKAFGYSLLFLLFAILVLAAYGFGQLWLHWTR